MFRSRDHIFRTRETVSRVLYLTVIYLDALSPERSSHPGSGRASHGAYAPAPIPVLLRIEFTATGTFTSRRVSSYLAFPPLPRRHKLPISPSAAKCRRYLFRGAACGAAKKQEACDDEAVYLCCTFPEVAFGGRYPLSLPCGARTFLMDRLSPLSPRPSDLLTQYNIVFCGGSQRGREDFIGKKN